MTSLSISIQLKLAEISKELTADEIRPALWEICLSMLIQHKTKNMGYLVKLMTDSSEMLKLYGEVSTCIATSCALRLFESAKTPEAALETYREMFKSGHVILKAFIKAREKLGIPWTQELTEEDLNKIANEVI